MGVDLEFGQWRNQKAYIFIVSAAYKEMNKTLLLFGAENKDKYMMKN